MTDYYHYLWSTTWPYLLVLFLIWGFVLFRLGIKWLQTWRQARDAWGFFVFTGKILVWCVVLGVYTEIFLFSQPDWFKQPGLIQGSVQSKSFRPEEGIYVLDIRSGSEQKQFYIDGTVYEQLKIDDQVKLTYLPVRHEVVRCELLSQSQ